MFFDFVKKYTKSLAILRNKKGEKFYILSAKKHLALVFLVSLKRKNILFYKMYAKKETKCLNFLFFFKQRRKSNEISSLWKRRYW